MTREQALEYVVSTLKGVIEQKGTTLDKTQLTESALLLGGDLPIDSLDLAAIVVQLEILTGKDPFAAGFINFRTLGELADLYVQ